jgi:hypothetical protein
MKSFFTWLFTTGNGLLQCIYWIALFVIFIWQGFKNVAYLVRVGDNGAANAFYVFSIVCVSAMCLITANNYKKRKK